MDAVLFMSQTNSVKAQLEVRASWMLCWVSKRSTQVEKKRSKPLLQRFQKEAPRPGRGPAAF